MKSHSPVLCILLFLTIPAGSESSVPSVTVKLHDSAVLPCSERCSGLVRWTVFHKRSDVLAECDQTSCRSVKEGYQMIHDQYLKENLSLTITGADFSKRGWYTSDCDGKDLCDVRLQIEALSSLVQTQHNESVFLDLHVSDPVEVVYSSTDEAGPSSDQICRVEGGSLQCRAEYSQRASLSLELRGMKESDGGVYTVRTIRTKDYLHIYTVSVRDDQLHSIRPPGAAVPMWVIPVLAVLGLVSVVVNVCQWIENRRLQEEKRPPRNRVDSSTLIKSPVQ